MLRARGTQTITYTQQFSVNSKLEVITGTNGITQSVTTFTYDGDGNRVKKVEDGVGTYYVGGIYEWQATKQTSYYYVAGQRIAMRVTVGVSTTLTYLHGDHLGSTSLSTDADGDELYRRGYYPYGEERYAVGVAVTDYGFTGQREEAYIDLIEMGARWYDSSIGRWISADSIVPDLGNAQSWKRYAYVYGNPMVHIGRGGHAPVPNASDPPQWTPTAAPPAWGRPTPVPMPTNNRPGRSARSDGYWWVEGPSDSWPLWDDQPQPPRPISNYETLCYADYDYSEVDLLSLGLDGVSIGLDFVPAAWAWGFIVDGADFAMESAEWTAAREAAEAGEITDIERASEGVDVVIAVVGFVPMVGILADSASILKNVVEGTTVDRWCGPNPSYVAPPAPFSQSPSSFFWWPE